MIKVAWERVTCGNVLRAFSASILIGAACLAFAADGGTDIGLDKPIGVVCAKACAKNGSTLVILRDDGTIFLPIDSKTPPFSSQNPRLMPFAGEHVTVTGKEYVRRVAHM